LGGGLQGSVIVTAPLTADAPVASPAPLVARLVSVTGGRVGATLITPEPRDLPSARSLAAKHGKLVYLQPEIASGELRVTADVYSAPKSFWERVKNPHPASAAHAFASRRLDAELHTFFPPVPLVAQGGFEKIDAPERRIVALACGDIDGDGALELLLVGRQRIVVGRVRHRRFVPLSSLEWQAASPVAPVPLREPIATAAITTGAYIDVGLSDRGDALRLGPSLLPLSRLGAKLPWPGTEACLPRAGLGFSGAARSCAGSEPVPALPKLAEEVDAVAGAVVIGKNGAPRLVRAARALGEATVVISDDRGQSARASGVGAQLAVGDLDFDGQPELLAGADTLETGGDALLVFTWLDDGRLVERFRLAVDAGVHALAICPPEHGGRPRAAIATQGGLWLLR
jgi:hypothetical protein